MKARRRSSDEGFTLAELLVALAITVALAGVMLAVTVTTLRVWRDAQDRFGTQSQAKLALDLLERDLHAAVFRETGDTWLAVDVIDLPAALGLHGWRLDGLLKPAGAESRRLRPESSLAEGRFGLAGAWLRFITTHVEAKNSAQPGGSVPVAVAYQVVRRPVAGGLGTENPAPPRYSLFRSVVAADTSFTTGMNVLAAGYGSGSSTPPASRSARSLTNPNTADALAANVVDFGVWLHARNGPGLLRIFPESDSDVGHVAVAAGEFPAVVDVMIRVLTEEGASRIEQMERGAGIARPAEFATDGAWWWAVAETHSHVYTRRIEIRRRDS